MTNYSVNEVVVYHDETKNVPGTNLKGHVLYFVPRELTIISETPLFGVESSKIYPAQSIYQKLIEIRNNHSFHSKFHFSEIRGKKWTKYDTAQRLGMELAVDSLKHKHAELFSLPLNCKFAVMFYPNLSRDNLYGGSSDEKRLRHEETVLRILLKGACHYLYDDQNRVSIHSLVSDGNPDFREFDDERILKRLTYQDDSGKHPLRDYVSIQSGAKIIHLPSDHTIHAESSDNLMHANLLQMADFLLGGTMRSCYNDMTRTTTIPRIGQECIKKDVIATPMRDVLEKTSRGAGFINSGHYKSFSISHVDFLDDEIRFRTMKPKDLIDTSEILQTKFEDILPRN
ncbi:MAG: DUF3800 domain-containing protein [Chloroflexota bacterium]